MFTGCLLVERHWRQGLRTAATLKLTSYLATQLWRLPRFFNDGTFTVSLFAQRFLLLGWAKLRPG